MRTLIKLNFILILILILFNGRGVSNSIFVFNLDVGFAFTSVLLLQIVSLFMLWTYKKIKVDIVAIMLFLQILLYTLVLLIFPDSLASMKYYVAALLSFATYIFFLNSTVATTNKTILLFSEIATLIISLQVVSVTINAFSNNVPFYLMKNYMELPIGGSNFVASFLLVFLVAIINFEEEKIRRFIFIPLGTLGILLTRSNGGLILLLIIFVFEYGKEILTNRSFLKTIKYLSLIVLSGFFMWKILGAFPDYFERYIVSLERIFTGGYAGLYEASNSRLYIYREALGKIAHSPIVGYGLNYRSDVIGLSAHNLILDLLLKAGVLNLILFTGYILMLLSTFNKYGKLDKEIKVFRNIILVVIMNGMFEQNLGGLNFDLFFWMFCGIGMAKVNSLKKTNGSKSKNRNFYKEPTVLSSE